MQNVGNTSEAADLFQTAIEISRGQPSRLLELRAATSLARLLLRSGARDAARTMLTEIYSHFTEGFDIADLKDAQALLDELKSHEENGNHPLRKPRKR